MGDCDGTVCDDGSCCPCPEGADCVCCPDGINCAYTTDDCPSLGIMKNAAVKGSVEAGCDGTMCGGRCCPCPDGAEYCGICCPDGTTCVFRAHDCPITTTAAKFLKNAAKKTKIMKKFVDEDECDGTVCDDGTCCECPDQDCVCCPDGVWCAVTLDDCGRAKKRDHIMKKAAKKNKWDNLMKMIVT